MTALRGLTLLGMVALAACGGGREQREEGGMEGTKGMDSAAGMRGMPGMQMMPRMRAQMDSMMGLSPQQMQAMMAGHQEMMSRMLDGMGAEMRGMNMAATPEWTALTDSVKQDLAELPNLTGPELSARMRAHSDRVKRLIALHEKMMGK